MCLEKLGEYHQFQRTWDIDVSVEREPLPEGAVEEEEDSEEEYEDATSGSIQSDAASASAVGQLVTDSGVVSHESQLSLEDASARQSELGEFLSYVWLLEFSRLSA